MHKHVDSAIDGAGDRTMMVMEMEVAMVMEMEVVMVMEMDVVMVMGALLLRELQQNPQRESTLRRHAIRIQARAL